MSTQPDSDLLPLSVVIPAYNHAIPLVRTISQIRDFLASRSRNAEIIVVDDGSMDDVASVAVREPGLPVTVLRNEENQGKGAAVRRGMLAARGATILMCDADGATPIAEIDRLAAALDAGADIAIGSRLARGARVARRQGPVRRVAAAMFRRLRRMLIVPAIRDTQCGFKLFRADAARAIFSRVEEDGWLFDCEALGVAEILGFRCAEIGVEWRHERDSRVRLWETAVRLLPRLWAIRGRLARLRAARRAY